MTMYHLKQEDVWQRHIKLLICNWSIHVLMQQPYNNIWWRQFENRKMGRIGKNSFLSIALFSCTMIRMQCISDNIYKSLILYWPNAWSQIVPSQGFSLYFTTRRSTFYSYKLNFCFLPNFCLMWKRLIFYIYT